MTGKINLHKIKQIQLYYVAGEGGRQKMSPVKLIMMPIPDFTNANTLYSARQINCEIMYRFRAFLKKINHVTALHMQNMCIFTLENYSIITLHENNMKHMKL